MDKILITGATGFIGSRLAEKLLPLHQEVRLLVRDPGKLTDGLRERCEVVVGDVTMPHSLKGCCRGVDVVFHMAALMGHDAPGREAFERFREVNVQGLKHMVEAAKEGQIRRFIHLSSTAAMGLPKEDGASGGCALNETAACLPYTPYQVTKHEGEQVLLEEYAKNRFPALILRPSMIYGPGFKGDFLTLAKVCKTGFFPVIGKGRNLSPALYIDDLIDVLPACADRGREGEVYLISSEESYPLSQVSKVIAEAMGKRLHYVYVPCWAALFGAGFIEKACMLSGRKPMVTRRNISSTIRDRIFDVGKAKAELGFCQSHTLEEGLSRTIRYFMQEGYL